MLSGAPLGSIPLSSLPGAAPVPPPFPFVTGLLYNGPDFTFDWTYPHGGILAESYSAVWTAGGLWTDGGLRIGIGVSTPVAISAPLRIAIPVLTRRVAGPPLKIAVPVVETQPVLLIQITVASVSPPPPTPPPPTSNCEPEPIDQGDPRSLEDIFTDLVVVPVVREPSP